MRVLLSTIGSRGDVQPMLALARELRDLGHGARLCAPPDFREWVEGFGFEFFPVGPEVRPTARPAASGPPTPEQVRQMMEGTVATQFETIPRAAENCDVIVGANALQIAARSVAEMNGARYVFVSYCPMTLPSPHHAPPAVMAWKPRDPKAGNVALWNEDAERWSLTWGSMLNAHRSSRGLEPATDVRRHILTDRPWLAADPTLAPWAQPADLVVDQPGAFILDDETSLAPEVARFLDAGEPPIYFGFGSLRAPQGLAESMIAAARALGRRAILLRGWAGLSLPDDSPDCLLLGEVNLQKLFERVAVAVHHGGAGTTHAAARAGAPQVVIPQHYDQPYWARRVSELQVGVAHPPEAPTIESLISSLRRALETRVLENARALAGRMRGDGARAAAHRLVEAAH